MNCRTSVTLSDRVEHAKSQAGLLSDWKVGVPRGVGVGVLTFIGLSIWGTAPDLVAFLIAMVAMIVGYIVPPAWRFLHGFWTARVAYLVRMVEELCAQIPETEGWEGVWLGDRYFAWSGPGLHGLEKWDPVPATPPELIPALEDEGHECNYTDLSRLGNALNEGRHQILRPTAGHGAVK